MGRQIETQCHEEMYPNKTTNTEGKQMLFHHTMHPQLSTAKLQGPKIQGHFKEITLCTISSHLSQHLSDDCQQTDK